MLLDINKVYAADLTIDEMFLYEEDYYSNSTIKKLEPVKVFGKISINSLDELKKLPPLTEEEKQTKVYYKHWFNKYLKINLKYGNPKYVYVGNYSNYQIKKIIKLAMSK